MGFFPKLLKFLIFASLLVFLIPAHLYRVVYFDVLVEVMFLIYAWLLVKGIIKPPKISLIGAAFFVFIAVSALATIFSVDPAKSFWGTPVRSMAGGLFVYMHYFAFFIVSSSVFSKKEDYLRLFKYFLVVSGIISLVGIYDFASGINRVYSLLGNPIYLGTFSLFPLFIGIFLFLSSKIKREKIFYFMSVLLSASSIYLSLSRGPIVGLLGSLILFCPLLLVLSIKYLKNNWQANKKLIVLYVAGASLVLLFGLVVVLKNENSLLARFQNVSQDRDVVSRLVSWEVAFDSVLDKPILGWGQENINLAYFANYSSKFIPDVSGEAWFDRAHNNILDIGITSGILGLVAYLAIWIMLFLALLRLFRWGQKTEAIILGILLVSYFISNLFFFDSLVTFLPFIFVLGFLSCLDRELIVIPQLSTGQIKKIKPVFNVVVIFMVLALVGNSQIARAGYYYNKIKFDKNRSFNELVMTYDKLLAMKFVPQSFKAEIVYSFSRIITQNNIDDENLYKLIAETSLKLNELARMNPIDIRPYYYNAKVAVLDFELNGNEDSLFDAKRYLEKATVLSPNRQDLYLDLAQVHVLDGDIDGAISSTKKAIELNYDFARAHFYLGILLIENGKQEDGGKELSVAEELGIKYAITDVANLIYLADFYISQNDNVEAIAILEDLLKVDWYNMIARKKLAALYTEVGYKIKAKEQVDFIINSDPALKSEAEEFLKYLEK